ncbi:MAG TPA: tRNA (adenosine(37)-N6)-threonylcarbamoyltransferase complex ATPase subunit type 1 TsaE [Stellaceae bacterium]
MHLADEAATASLAATIARAARPGDVIALSGDLGAGKTSFARAFIRALGRGDEDVPSPTFTLVQTYELPAATIWHFDLYRLERPDDVLELGFEDAAAEGGIVLVEWPDRAGGLLPRDRLDLSLTVAAASGGDPAATARRATLATQSPAWQERLERLFRD